MSKGPCAGLLFELCPFCLCRVSTHEGGVGRCQQRQFPKPGDWTQYAATQPHLQVRAATRGAPNSAAPPQARGHSQTDRSSEQKEAYRKASKVWHQREQRRLDDQAQQRLIERVRRLKQPLKPSSESGEFSDYEKLQHEFAALSLHSKARAASPPQQPHASIHTRCGGASGCFPSAQLIRSGPARRRSRPSCWSRATSIS